MSFDLSNYTTVNERIIQFYDRYPTGVILLTRQRLLKLAPARSSACLQRCIQALMRQRSSQKHGSPTPEKPHIRGTPR